MFETVCVGAVMLACGVAVISLLVDIVKDIKRYILNREG